MSDPAELGKWVVGLAQRLSSLPGLAVFDLGSKGSLFSWGDDTAISDLERWPAHIRSQLRPSPVDPTMPYSGGWVGWLTYEAGGPLLGLDLPQGPLPAVQLWRTEGAIWLRPEGVWQVGGSPGFCAQAEALLQGLDPLPLPSSPALDWHPPSRPAFLAGVVDTLAEIGRGEVYQLNLSWPQRCARPPQGLDLWLRLRAANPAERGAYLRRGEVELVSNSPELFLEVSPKGELRTLPIKGTVPLAAGELGRQHLERSEKERAELTMIVDLMRNDLGRVAQIGSVRTGERQLRRCGDLLHAEQEVRAQLAQGRDAMDALCAAFPPGSVTGAPKRSAVSIIRRLEGAPRGAYCGCMGYFADGGAAHWNVAIRTITLSGAEASFHVGAGIVADSEPEQEWKETVAKGQALYRCLAASMPSPTPRTVTPESGAGG